MCTNDTARWDKDSRDTCPICGSQGIAETPVEIEQEIVAEIAKPKRTIKEKVSAIVKKVTKKK